jgi:hypothetical protein
MAENLQTNLSLPNGSRRAICEVPLAPRFVSGLVREDTIIPQDSSHVDALRRNFQDGIRERPSTPNFSAALFIVYAGHRYYEGPSCHHLYLKDVPSREELKLFR